MKIVVTRPAHQAVELIEGLKAIGCEAVSVPTVQIEPMSFSAISQPDLFIVTSVNAARFFCELAITVNSQPIISVGPTTASYLAARGYSVTSPERLYTSEGVLELPDLQQVSGKCVAIVKGEGGRETLAQALKKRSAVVEEWNLYRRVAPSNIHLPSFEGADVIWVSSYESFTNLYQLGREIWHDLTKLIWMVPSQRIADMIKDQVGQVTVADSALNKDVIALCQEIINDKRKPERTEERNH